MTSKNFNRVLTVVVNKLNKCYFNFSKPDSMRSSTIMKSVNLIDHEMTLTIDDELYLAIEVDGTRMAEVNLESEVKNSNELFVKVDHLVSMLYSGIYNGEYDIASLLEDNEETSDFDDNDEYEETEKVDIDETYTDNLEDCTDEFATQYAEETNRLATPTHDADHDRTKYLMETHSFPSSPTYDTKAFYGMYGQFPSIAEMYNDKCFCCLADRKGNECKGKETCSKTWKRFEAIAKPEWHHVNLATLANIDNDMLDEKRQNYMYLRNLLKDFRKYAFNIKRRDVYFDMVSNVIRDIQQMWFNSTISFTAYEYAMRHLQVVSVEKGYFDSRREAVFSFKESRRYKVTLR